MLSLVICSRNDSYAGNSVHRLQTALNYLAFQVDALGLREAVEVVVTDWGSDEPLRQVLDLTEPAKALTYFLEVPPDLARSRRKDSPFPEVLANNAAIRRARGRFIGRIDQDTLVGRAFLTRFLERFSSEGCEAERSGETFYFIGRRSVPLRFAASCPGLPEVVAFIDRFGAFLPREGLGQRPWFDAPVGVVLMHRDLWRACTGYDERLLYWGFMETDLGYRIGSRYRVVDLAPSLGCSFYHLSHARRRIRITDRKTNPRRLPGEFSPNDDHWGLGDVDLPLLQADASRTGDKGESEPKPKAGASTAAAVELFKEWLWMAVLTMARYLRGPFVGERLQRSTDARERSGTG